MIRYTMAIFLARLGGTAMPQIFKFVMLGLVAFSVAVFAFFAIATFFTSLFEKRPIAYYVPMARDEQTSRSDPLPAYLEAMSCAITNAGFIDQTVCRHVKGGTYRMYGCTALSPHRETLVVVAAGTMLRLPYRRTTLQTWVADRLFMTTDEFGSPDIISLVDRVVVKNADLPELMAHHYARLQPVWHLVRCYESGPVASYEANNRVIADTMERMGLGRYTSPERASWRNTVKGAVILTAKAMYMMLNPGQRDRMRRPRPGDEKYNSLSPIPSGFPIETSQVVAGDKTAPQ
jgi:hypothetical protein